MIENMLIDYVTTQAGKPAEHSYPGEDPRTNRAWTGLRVTGNGRVRFLSDEDFEAMHTD